jgi:signal transduction histidine kinase
LLVEHQYTQNGASLFITSGNGKAGGVSVVTRAAGVLPGTAGGLLPGGVPTPVALEAQAHAKSAAALNQLMLNSGIALGIMALVSIWLGWLVAGRALRPLRTIASTAREISASNLHRRLGLEGPDDEIKQLGSTFDELLGRLESSFEAQRQFVANASHELRTPLTLERALVEVALTDRDADIASLRMMGEQVLAVGAQQERLIEALLTLSRGQRGLDRHEPVDLLAITREALDTVDDESLTIAPRLEPAATTGDPRLLERLVTNLVTNAVRHNTPHGRIEVRTETRAGRALLTIENTGPTIPPNELDRLFQPFQRLESERMNGTGGLGLGLSIVQAVATAHQATLEAQPRPGGGLHVEIGFPSSLMPGTQRPTPTASLATRQSAG